MVAEGAAGGACHLFQGGAAADPGDDRGVPAGCGPCAEYLSSFVAVDPVGTESAESPGRVSPERLQAAVPKLQPSVAGGSVRSVQGWRILARVAAEVLSGDGRADDSDDGGLRSSLAGHLPKVRGPVPRAQPVRARQVRGARMGRRQV